MIELIRGSVILVTRIGAVIVDARSNRAGKTEGWLVLSVSGIMFMYTVVMQLLGKLYYLRPLGKNMVLFSRHIDDYRWLADKFYLGALVVLTVIYIIFLVKTWLKKTIGNREICAIAAFLSTMVAAVVFMDPVLLIGGIAAFAIYMKKLEKMCAEA